MRTRDDIVVEMDNLQEKIVALRKELAEISCPYKKGDILQNKSNINRKIIFDHCIPKRYYSRYSANFEISGFNILKSGKQGAQIKITYPDQWENI